MPKQSIKPRADGRYMVSYKRHCFYGTTAKEAMNKRAAYIREESRGLKHDQSGETFAQYATRWLPVYRSKCSEGQYNQYAHYIMTACAYIGKYSMCDIVQSDIVELYNNCANKSHSHNAKFCNLIRAIFRSAYADGLCLRDPSVNAPTPEGPRGEHRPLTDAEKSYVIRLTDHRFGLAAMVMLFAGLRRGEMVALDIDRDVDFDKKTITVRESVRFENGQHPVISPGKTENAQRTIPLLAPLEDAMRGHHGRLIVPSKSETITLQVVNRAFESYKVAINELTNGMTKRKHTELTKKDPSTPPWKETDIRMHDFRYTFCQMLFDADVPMKTAQQWMGHADPEMIMRVYDKSSTFREKKAENSLSEHFKLSKWLSNGVK